LTSCSAFPRSLCLRWSSAARRSPGYPLADKPYSTCVRYMTRGLSWRVPGFDRRHTSGNDGLPRWLWLYIISERCSSSREEWHRSIRSSRTSLEHIADANGKVVDLARAFAESQDSRPDPIFLTPFSRRCQRDVTRPASSSRRLRSAPGPCASADARLRPGRPGRERPCRVGRRGRRRHRRPAPSPQRRE